MKDDDDFTRKYRDYHPDDREPVDDAGNSDLLLEKALAFLTLGVALMFGFVAITWYLWPAARERHDNLDVLLFAGIAIAVCWGTIRYWPGAGLPPRAARRTAYAVGDNIEIEFDIDTGTVIHIVMPPTRQLLEKDRPWRIDVDEWCRHYGRQFAEGETLDLMDLGFWTANEERHLPAVPGFRDALHAARYGE